MSQEVALHHHDRWDGGETGYPGNIRLSDFSIKDGIVPKTEPLSGNDIPLSARIVAIADVFDALSSARVYKPPFTFDEAINLIKEGAGTQFDPKCVEVFLESISEVKKIYRKYQES